MSGPVEGLSVETAARDGYCYIFPSKSQRSLTFLTMELLVSAVLL
jgi:hypothetical protein